MEQRLKAVLVGVDFDDQENFTGSMEELANLAAACDLEVVGQITQKLDHPHPAYYIGRGKLQEVRVLLEGVNGEVVIFNDELSPSQIRNLEAALDSRILDRTVLILDIFAQRAKTKEAKLQVEIASLQYMLPRLTGKGLQLSRQGAGAGVTSRGAGETKLELDRRKIEDRISKLNKELETLVSQRQNQRKKRKKTGVPVVALVGYTNSGKSTIMNAMLDLYNSPSDKRSLKRICFATLETSVRRIKLPDNKIFLLTIPWDLSASCLINWSRHSAQPWKRWLKPMYWFT